MSTKFLVALSAALALAPASAEIYKSVGADGLVSYTNVKPESRKTALVQAQADGSRTLSPDVIGAVANVMGVAQLVSSSRAFCGAAMPAADKRYAAAAQGWELRNAAVVAQKNRVLSHPVQQMVADALAADMLRKTADLMQPVKASDAAARMQWCDKAFADVDRGVLDLVGRPSIAPLMRYGRH